MDSKDPLLLLLLLLLLLVVLVPITAKAPSFEFDKKKEQFVDSCRKIYDDRRVSFDTNITNVFQFVLHITHLSLAVMLNFSACSASDTARAT